MKIAKVEQFALLPNRPATTIDNRQPTTTKQQSFRYRIAINKYIFLYRYSDGDRGGGEVTCVST